ncbi:MAG: hypothetical protein JWQ71_2908 [Pedosphaera sp.]|nr:hypothetical protein [Pedosphaera sp.]
MKSYTQFSDNLATFRLRISGRFNRFCNMQIFLSNPRSIPILFSNSCDITAFWLVFEFISQNEFAKALSHFIHGA